MQDSTFIGLDVHKATISVAVVQGERGGEVRHWGTVPHRPDQVRKLAEKPLWLPPVMQEVFDPFGV